MCGDDRITTASSSAIKRERNGCRLKLGGEQPPPPLNEGGTLRRGSGWITARNRWKQKVTEVPFSYGEDSSVIWGI